MPFGGGFVAVGVLDGSADAMGGLALPEAVGAALTVGADDALGGATWLGAPVAGAAELVGVVAETGVVLRPRKNNTAPSITRINTPTPISTP